MTKNRHIPRFEPRLLERAAQAEEESRHSIRWSRLGVESARVVVAKSIDASIDASGRRLALRRIPAAIDSSMPPTEYEPQHANSDRNPCLSRLHRVTAQARDAPDGKYCVDSNRRPHQNPDEFHACA